MISKISFYQEGEASCSPYHNLALEKYLTFHAREGECILFLWQNARTVVIGKNQNAWKECHVSRLAADGGNLARRLSGGGAVYHDMGNLNFSFCVRKIDYSVPRQMHVILRAVRSLGIPAEMSGRNDLTAEGKKFSGNAFYQSGEFCCHHGTLMVDVSRERLSDYLNVPPDKLRSKGVDSVRSRVVNLSELAPGLTTSVLAEALKQAFCREYAVEALPEDIELSPDRLAWEEIGKDESFFASGDWIYGRKLPFTHRMEARYAWGSLELVLKVDGGRITDCICYSDAMDPESISRIPGLLKGRRYEKEELLSHLPSGDKAAEGLRDLIEKEL